MMEPIELFTLVPCDGEPPVARLLSNGRDVGEVNGRAIEAQFRCGRGYVLIASDGNPLEEVVHIYLLGPDFHAVDLVWLGAMYHSGAVRDISSCGDDCVEFAFFGGSNRWRLTIRNTPKVSWLPSVISTVRYPGGWLRPHYLQLDRI
jgi:hypothetical protein